MPWSIVCNAIVSASWRFLVKRRRRRKTMKWKQKNNLQPSLQLSRKRQQQKLMPNQRLLLTKWQLLATVHLCRMHKSNENGNRAPELAPAAVALARVAAALVAAVAVAAQPAVRAVAVARAQ